MTNSGTNNRRKLPSSSICDIITACKESGVKLLRYQGLELHFTESTVEPVCENKEISQEVLKEVAHHADIEGRDYEVQEDIDLMAIEDPVRFEEYINSEDATEGDSEGHKPT